MSMHPNFFSLGLIGWPLEHSFSPRMHNAALHALNLAGEYRLYLVPPLPSGKVGLAELLDQMRQGKIKGLNVTIPHKQNVIPLVDDLTPAAQAIGAVNMIYTKGKHLVGSNTDAPGYMKDLKRVFPSLFEKPEPTALVIGAGGSARAVVYALAQSGWRVAITARRLDQAEELAASLTLDQPACITPLPLHEIALTGQYALVVNTTPLGMFPNIGASPWPSSMPFPAGAAVYDLVYNPPETALLRAARDAGLPTANGLGMLFEQAAAAFETWTGLPAPRVAMRMSLAFDKENL
jgi:shikimate dehydrogenase